MFPLMDDTTLAKITQTGDSQLYHSYVLKTLLNHSHDHAFISLINLFHTKSPTLGQSHGMTQNEVIVVSMMPTCYAKS